MMTMDKHQIADLLLEAQRTGIALDPSLRQPFTLEEAYEVQKCVAEKKIKQGNKMIGKKIGFTSQAMRDALGIDQPDYGNLF